VLVVDSANVVGHTPDGWWRDRPGAAKRLHDRIAATDLGYDVVVIILEGQARRGQPIGEVGPLQTVHAPADGDDEIVDQVRAWVAEGDDVVVVTADRALRKRILEAEADFLGPSWLLDQLPSQVARGRVQGGSSPGCRPPSGTKVPPCRRHPKMPARPTPAMSREAA
jgi:hypothetical protein